MDTDAAVAAIAEMRAALDKLESALRAGSSSGSARGAATSAGMLTGAEVATLLRRKADWFYRNHPRLTAEHGFPAPVPGIGRALWSRSAVEAWIDRQAGSGGDAAAEREMEARLAERGRRVAAGAADDDWGERARRAAGLSKRRR